MKSTKDLIKQANIEFDNLTALQQKQLGFINYEYDMNKVLTAEQVNQLVDMTILSKENRDTDEDWALLENVWERRKTLSREAMASFKRIAAKKQRLGTLPKFERIALLDMVGVKSYTFDDHDEFHGQEKENSHFSIDFEIKL